MAKKKMFCIMCNFLFDQKKKKEKKNLQKKT